MLIVGLRIVVIYNVVTRLQNTTERNWRQSGFQSTTERNWRQTSKCCVRNNTILELLVRLFRSKKFTLRRLKARPQIPLRSEQPHYTGTGSFINFYYPILKFFRGVIQLLLQRVDRGSGPRTLCSKYTDDVFLKSGFNERGHTCTGLWCYNITQKRRLNKEMDSSSNKYFCNAIPGNGFGSIYSWLASGLSALINLAFAII